ncbi:MAG: radical SAM protein, partial [Thermomicrobiales bacterium]
GEPTVHPQIADILQEAATRNVTRVILNTNGLRIARDDRFMETLAKLRGRLEIYLQFDGFKLATHLFHRGEDLRAVKEEALRRLTGERVFTTLAMAVARGVNDDEVGAVADFACATDYIGGVAFQPVFGSGRAAPIDPLDRVTTTGTLRRLGEQTAGRIGPEDFIALPCSHPDCCSIAYFVRGDAGQFNSIVRLLGHERLKANLGLVGNRIAADEDALGQALLGMMSETTTITRPELLDYVLTLCDNCDLGLTGFVRQVTHTLLRRDVPVEPISKRLKRFTVKSFMDAWTLNAERLQQCCVHVGSTDDEANPVRVPFCARQLFGDLRRRTSAGQAPAAQLIPLDRKRRVLR